MPVNWRRYPPHWKTFSAAIRHARARDRCECTGQCGLHQPNPTTRRCKEKDRTGAQYANGLIHLTVAHLCQCDPPCTNPGHVIAACQRCHLRIDRKLHAAHARLTRTQRTKFPLDLSNTKPIIRTRPPHPWRDTRRRF